MAFDRAKKYLDSKGYGDRIIIPEHSSATVAEAAEALGCEPGMIAKTLSFLQNDRPMLILAEGTVRIDNKKYRSCFGCKAKMIPVTVYLDESLKMHETVYPAAGMDHSAVRLAINELEECCGYPRWVDVCKLTD